MSLTVQSNSIVDSYIPETNQTVNFFRCTTQQKKSKNKQKNKTPKNKNTTQLLENKNTFQTHSLGNQIYTLWGKNNDYEKPRNYR